MESVVLTAIPVILNVPNLQTGSQYEIINYAKWGIGNRRYKIYYCSITDGLIFPVDFRLLKFISGMEIDFAPGSGYLISFFSRTVFRLTCSR